MNQRHSSLLGRTPPIFALEKQSKKLNFRSFLSLKKTFVATFNETGAPTSRKYAAEQGIMMPNL